MMKFYLSSLFFVVLITLSCNSAYKGSVYFEGIDRNSAISHKIDNYAPTTIQVGDILGLYVKSLNPEGSAIFNCDNGGGSSSSSGSGSSNSSSSSNSSCGYPVDRNGEINLPLVHNVKVLGLTIIEAQNAIQKAILAYLKEPTVTVKILNFRITILGDVGNPSTYTVTSEHISIPQALSLAGDITITGKRSNILLIREINGERKFVNIDINSNKFFESPYYYLKNNDMLYVEAGKGKFYAVDPLKQTLPLVISFISLILVGLSLSRTYKL